MSISYCKSKPNVLLDVSTCVRRKEYLRKNDRKMNITLFLYKSYNMLRGCLIANSGICAVWADVDCNFVFVFVAGAGAAALWFCTLIQAFSYSVLCGLLKESVVSNVLKAFIKPPTEIKCLLSFCVCVSEVNPTNHPSKKHKVFSIYTYTEKKENLAKEIFFCWKQKIASSFLLIRFFARKKSLRFFLSDNCFWREFPQRI